MRAAAWYLLGFGSGFLMAIIVTAFVIGVILNDLKLLWRHQHR